MPILQLHCIFTSLAILHQSPFSESPLPTPITVKWCKAIAYIQLIQSNGSLAASGLLELVPVVCLAALLLC